MEAGSGSSTLISMISRADQRVLVGVDGSTNSVYALDYAAAEARFMQRELEIIYVGIVWSEGGFLDGLERLVRPVDAMQEYGQRLLDRARNRIRRRYPDVTCHTRYQTGRPVDVLLGLAENAAALVVGRHGAGASGVGNFVGSVATRLAAAADCPVFVVGARGTITARGPILVAVDGSESSAAALRFALEEAARRETEVRMVTAYQWPALTAPTDPDLIRMLEASTRQHAMATARDTLAGARATVGSRVADPTTTAVEQEVVRDHPVKAIVRRASEAQLIVLGSHGRGPVQRWLLGSVSARVLDGTEIPVVIIGPRAGVDPATEAESTDTTSTAEPRQA